MTDTRRALLDMNDPKTRRALLARLKTTDRRVFQLMLDFDAALKKAGIDVDAYPDPQNHPDPMVRAHHFLRDAAMAIDQAALAPASCAQEARERSAQEARERRELDEREAEWQRGRKLRARLKHLRTLYLQHQGDEHDQEGPVLHWPPQMPVLK